MSKDNPVPSLEELAEKFCKDRYHHAVKDGILQFVEFVNKQNGVETNKVQPNKDTYTTIYCKKNNSAGNCSCKGVCNRGWKDF